jgi:NADH dehydrogenase
MLHYDRMIVAAGSRIARPELPGMDNAFGVDNFAEALALSRHVESLPARREFDDTTRFSAVVVGAGFTGIEVATSLVGRIRRVSGRQPRVALVERAGSVAPDMSTGARAYVERALATLGIEVRAHRTVTAIRNDGVALHDGAWVPAATTIWTGGFRAGGLTSLLGVECDAAGRLPVDAALRVRGVNGVYAAGDAAHAMLADGHVAPMSCQYAIPMGEIAGVNGVADLCGAPLEAFTSAPYVTCLDLGDAGALFTEGWDREVKLTGSWAATMKRTINQQLIYPPAARFGVRPAARPAA